jgi:hypothetical protein
VILAWWAGPSLVLLCYKRSAPQKGQRVSCRSGKLAMVRRSEAMEWGIMPSAGDGGRPRGSKPGGRAVAVWASWPARAEGEKRLSATRNP